jgi:hypothetical protein
MKPQASAPIDSFDDHLIGVEEAEERSEDDLWFLPGCRVWFPISIEAVS